MIVHVDTSALVDALTGPRRSLTTLIDLTQRGERLALSSIVLYEWLRGPRTKGELAAQESLFPAVDAIPFGPDEAATASRLYQQLARPRGREIDVAIAAVAVTSGAVLWTLNVKDFRDIGEVTLL